MPLIIGTCYFPSEYAAVRYERRSYAGPGAFKLAKATVRRKISEGAIYIGKPPLKEGESAVLIDDGLRYAIVEAG